MTYKWQTDLATILRKAGVPVIEESGWKARGRPVSFPFNPGGIVRHWDASNMGPSPDVLNTIKVGTADIPGPLAQLWTCRGFKGDAYRPAHGISVHVIAAGRCNHAGLGSGYGSIKADRGNELAIGWEIDQTVNEPWPKELLDIQRHGEAAILKAKGWKTLCGHSEYAPDRKIDVSGGSHGLDMTKERLIVHGYMNPPKPPKPPVPPIPKPPEPKPPVGEVMPLFVSLSTVNQLIGKDQLIAWEIEGSDPEDLHASDYARIGPFKNRVRVAVNITLDCDLTPTVLKIQCFDKDNIAGSVKQVITPPNNRFEASSIFTVAQGDSFKVLTQKGTLLSGSIRLLGWEY